MENHKKHSLGHRAFFIFFSRHSTTVVVLFIITGFVLYGEQWVPPAFAPWGWYGFELILALAVTMFLIALLRTYMEYKVYTYMFTEEAFVMTFGYFIHNEVTALYHQIQNVNILRSPGDRLAGVSKIVIVMAGGDRDSDRNKIVLPGVGRKKAKLVQQELLVRARRHVPGYFPPSGEDEGEGSDGRAPSIPKIKKSY